jgi:hypothetical protein
MSGSLNTHHRYDWLEYCLCQSPIGRLRFEPGYGLVRLLQYEKQLTDFKTKLNAHLVGLELV